MSKQGQSLGKEGQLTVLVCFSSDNKLSIASCSLPSYSEVTQNLSQMQVIFILFHLFVISCTFQFTSLALATYSQ